MHFYVSAADVRRGFKLSPGVPLSVPYSLPLYLEMMNIVFFLGVLTLLAVTSAAEDGKYPRHTTHSLVPK